MAKNIDLNYKPLKVKIPIIRKMKILLFTHKSDIDGMGSVVLSKLAFKQVDYVLCETFNLQKEIEKYYQNKTIYDYDKIFITDLCPEKSDLEKIKNDKKLENKCFVFDHHKSAIGGGLLITHL